MNFLFCFVLFFLNVTKSFYRESGGGVGLGAFPGDAPFAQVDGVVFTVLEEEQRTKQHLYSLTVRPPTGRFSTGAF